MQPPGDGTSARDADIVAYIKAATPPVIEYLVGPVLPQTKTIMLDGGKLGVLLPGAIANPAAVTAVRVDGGAWSGYTVNADSGIVYAGPPTWSGLRFPPGVRNVEVDLTIGYNPVPDGLQLAARELVRYWVQIGKQSPAGGVLNLQTDSTADPIDPYAIPPRRVRQLCGPFMGGGFA